MITNFQYRYDDGSLQDSVNITKVSSASELTEEERRRLSIIQEQWDFYEGYHWEKIEDTDAPQVTVNYCRTFVNKYVAFEFGKGFSITVPRYLEDIPITINDTIRLIDFDSDRDGVVSDDEIGSVVVREKTVPEFLEEVWGKNNKDTLITEIGQMKSITGDAWVGVKFISAEDLGDKDPFNENQNGKIELSLLPTQYAFPRFNDHDRNVIDEFLVMYPIHREKITGFLNRRHEYETILYKELWTSDEIKVYEGDTLVDTMENPYGFIPYVQFKNFPVAGRSFGASDIDDVIPLNTEFNTKNSDVSEVIDYHSAPITLVYGAKIGNLEKGANKVWGGLPKDSKVENLQLNGDLTASQSYISRIKTSMCEVGAVPESVIGGAQAISNTSGVALQYMNLPLVDRTNVKRNCTETSIIKLNKMILVIAEVEGLIVIPEGMSRADFLVNYVKLPDTLPKDTLLELQQIQIEMMNGLECRHGALERLGRDDISGKLAEIDVEREAHPEIFNPSLQNIWYANQPKFNSGMANGQSPQEQMNVELNGENVKNFL